MLPAGYKASDRKAKFTSVAMAHVMHFILILNGTKVRNLAVVY